MGSAPGPYAFAATTEGTKRCRGTSRMAWRTRGSVMPRAATWRSTMSARRCANSRSFAADSPFCEMAKTLLERLETGDGLVMGHVEMERRDGNVAEVHGLEIGPLSRLPDRGLAADPVVLPSPWVDPFDDALAVGPLAELRDPHAGEGPDREVDVEDDVRIARMLERPAGQLQREGGAAVEREVLADQGRQR